MKDIDTLVKDIEGVLEGNGGWDATVAAHFDQAVNTLMDVRLNPSGEARKGTLRMSNVGQPCGRKLWYHVNNEPGENLRASTRLKFLYGDLIEEVVLSLAEAAGHDVQGRQDRMELAGIVGHRDGVIDGMLVDVKSASTFGFKKFKEHELRKEDPFGYLMQLSSYLLASRDDPLVTNKREAAFLVMDKQHGHLVLDKYDLTHEMATLESMIERRKKMVKDAIPPARGYTDKAFQKSGNRQLGIECSYCEYKHSCWPGLRTFLYSRGPVFLTEVNKEPDVKEV